MSRTPAKVTQADIARALRALQQSGIEGIVEILPDGTIRIVPARLARLVQTQEEVEPIEL